MKTRVNKQKKIEEKIKLAQEESCKKDIEISRIKSQQQATIEAYKISVPGPESPQSLLGSKTTRKAQPKEKPGLKNRKLQSFKQTSTQNPVHSSVQNFCNGFFSGMKAEDFPLAEFSKLMGLCCMIVC